MNIALYRSFFLSDKRIRQSDATNALKYFLIGQLVQFFLLIGPSNAFKAFVARLWPQSKTIQFQLDIYTHTHTFTRAQAQHIHAYISHVKLIKLINYYFETLVGCGSTKIWKRRNHWQYYLNMDSKDNRKYFHRLTNVQTLTI